MSIKYDYIEAPESTEAAINFMKDTLMPLFKEYWDKYGEAIYKKEFIFNVMAFTQMWLLGDLIIIGVYDNEKAVGFLLGIPFTPVPYRANVLQIEQWYVQDSKYEKGLFDYLFSILKIKNITEVWNNSSVVGTPYIPWKKTNTFQLNIYRR